MLGKSQRASVMLTGPGRWERGDSWRGRSPWGWNRTGFCAIASHGLQGTESYPRLPGFLLY